MSEKCKKCGQELSFGDEWHQGCDTIVALKFALKEALEGWKLMGKEWVQQYAPEECDEQEVKKTAQRIFEAGGTLYRIAMDSKRIKELREQFLTDK